jgi:phosphotransferase system HPr (HPr) family protein
MMEEMTGRLVTIVNPQGLHARPARLFVELANSFDADIEVVKDGQHADGKSILSILTLAAEEGTPLWLRATGRDAHDALAALAELVEQGFGVEEDAEENETLHEHGLEGSESAEAQSRRGQ